MLCDLIIDGNLLLNRIVFTLNKNNLLFGALLSSLENTVQGYRKIYPFTNIYLVSDSKEKSWRKKFHKEYKSTRKKDSNIDWEFVFNTYIEFKENLKGNNIKIMEAPHIEGDDWISFIAEKSNQNGRSTIIISNDYDIKQLVYYSHNPLTINIMSNEFYNKQKIFLPHNWRIFLDTMKSNDNGDIFNLSNDKEFIDLLEKFYSKYEIIEVNNMESIVMKIISGDSSDNIPAVWSIYKNGRKRGIGERGAKSIIDEYVTTFGDLSLDDPDLSENIADLICEKKKLAKSNMDSIKKNIDLNKRLTILRTDSIPPEVLNRMLAVWESFKTIK